MKRIHQVAAVLSILALTTAGTALADQNLASVGTLTIPPPFGSLPVAAWSWGASNSSTIVGGGGGAGRPHDLSITRAIDGQSPLFFRVVARGEHLPTVTLVDGPTTITLTNVLITGYSTGDTPPGNSVTRLENISFAFEKAVYTVNGVTACFNFSAQTSC